MKQLTFFLFAVITLGVASCGRPQEPASAVSLGKQKIVISEIYTAKHSKVYFQYTMPLPNGQSIILEAENSASGYYYKKYNLEVGDTLTEEVKIIQDGWNFHVANIDFSKYEIK